MKFALDATGAQYAGQGIGNLFKAIALAPQLRERAEADAALRDAQIYSANMAGNQRGADAELKRTQNTYAADPMTSVLTRLMIPLNQRGAVEQKINTGSFGPQFDALPADQAGPALPAPVDDERMRKVSDYLAAAQMMYGTGSNVQQASEAELNRQTGNIREQALANTGDLDTMNRLNALAKPGATYTPIQAVGTSGRTVNTATGAGGVLDAVMAKLFDNVETAEAARNNAAARKSGADAAIDEERLGVLRKTGRLPGSGAGGGDSAEYSRALDDGRAEYNLRYPLDLTGKRPKGAPDVDAFMAQYLTRQGFDPKAYTMSGGAAGAPAAAVPGQNGGPAPEATKTLNGKTYVKIGGQWFEK